MQYITCIRNIMLHIHCGVLAYTIGGTGLDHQEW